jgi:spore coat protein U-like protein
MIHRILTVIALLASVSALPVVDAAQAATVHATMSVTATVTAACTMQVANGQGVNVRCSMATPYTVMATSGAAPGITVATADANVETMLVAY